MSYWQLFYHLVWATKNRAPLLDETVEPEVYGLLCTMAGKLKANVMALNGMPDHVHLIVSIPPTVSLSQFMSRIKGASSTLYNKNHISAPIYWQDDYSAFSCDPRCLQRHLDYVRRQKEHHQHGTTLPLLEAPIQSMADRVEESGVTYDPFMPGLA